MTTNHTSRRRGLAALVATVAKGLAGASCSSASTSDPTPPPTSSTTTSSATTASTATPSTATPSPATASTVLATPTTATPAVTATVAPPPRPIATVDGLVSVGGARMHVRCTGAGPTTVLLVSGLMGDHTDFADIEPRVAEMSRVCSYDRFGTGTSDAPPATQTFATQARDLRAALAALGDPGPFVLVGHSFGGAVAVSFTSLHPSDVRGVLLLDASPPTWNAAACSVADDGSAGADVWIQACAMQANNLEALDGPAAFAELAAIRSLGDIPMIVVTAADHDYTADDFDPATAARLTDAWFDGQDQWVSLSSDARLISVDDTGHHIQRDQPDLVIAQVADLLHHPS